MYMSWVYLTSRRVTVFYCKFQSSITTERSNSCVPVKPALFIINWTLDGVKLILYESIQLKAMEAKLRFRLSTVQLLEGIF